LRTEAGIAAKFGRCAALPMALRRHDPADCSPSGTPRRPRHSGHRFNGLSWKPQEGVRRRSRIAVIRVRRIVAVVLPRSGALCKVALRSALGGRQQDYIGAARHSDCAVCPGTEGFRAVSGGAAYAQTIVGPATGAGVCFGTGEACLPSRLRLHVATVRWPREREEKHSLWAWRGH
jgi:hypothetical protein